MAEQIRRSAAGRQDMAGFKEFPSHGRSRARSAKGGSRGGVGKKIAIGAGVVLIAAALCGGVAFASTAQKYRNTFLPGTIINGMDASGKTVEEIKQAIAANADGYSLKILEKDGESETIPGSDISLKTTFDGSLEKMMEEQNPYDWLKRKNNPQSFTIGTMIEFDKDKLSGEIDGLKLTDKDLVTKPANAYISEYQSGKGYEIIPENEGNEVDADKLLAAVNTAVENLQGELDLEKEGIYKKPSVTKDDPTLKTQLAALNKAVGITITTKYTSQEVLNGDTIHKWINVDDSGNLTVYADQLNAYVKSMADKYNTVGKSKKFKTSYGTTISVGGGSFGWKLDQSKEAADLQAAIIKGESVTRDAEWAQKADGTANDGIGSTYVEVNLTGQHLYYYKNGSLVLESDFVSGNVSKGNGTPDGVYRVAYKQRNATLKGENYSTPVSFWMPFNNGIGFHDATWRSQFGGTIYKTSGSHGCINMPYEKAKALFGSIEAGCPVICYGAPGTERTTKSNADGTAVTTKAANATKAAKAPETTKAPEATKAPETAKTTETAAPAAGPADDTGNVANGPAAEGTN